MAKLSDLFGRGVLASRPAAGIAGRHYHSTDSTPPTTYRDNGSSWDAEATAGMAAVTTTRGDLIVRGASADGRLAVGSASTGLFSDGTDPSWRKALPADIDVSADNTTGNATNGHHGWLPKLSGAATDYLDGSGAWSTPAGGGGGGGGGGAAVFSGVHLTRGSAQSIANNTLTAVLWDTETYDTDGYHSTVSNTSRMTAPVTGKYLIEATVSFASSGSGTQRYVDVVKNGTDIIGADNWPFVATNTQGVVHAMALLTAGDYVEVRVYEDSGGALNLGPGAGTHASMTLMAGAPAAGFIGASAYASGTQAITSNTETPLVFDTETYDTDGIHSVAVNTSRFTVPAGGAGYWAGSAYVPWDTSTAGSVRYVWWRKNGTRILGSLVSGPGSSFGLDQRCVLPPVLLADGDYLEAAVWNDSGSGRTLSPAGGDQKASATVWRVADSIASAPAGTVLAFKQVANSVGTFTTSSAAYVDVSATEAVVSFIAPSSGKVIVELETAYKGSANADAAWAVHDGTSIVAETYTPPLTNIIVGRRSLLVAGLTPGASYTYTWRVKIAGGATLTMYADASAAYAGGPMSMRVIAAP